MDEWYNVGDRAFVGPLFSLHRHHSNLAVRSRMDWHDTGKRPLCGNHMFLSQTDYVVDLSIPKNGIPL